MDFLRIMQVKVAGWLNRKVNSCSSVTEEGGGFLLFACCPEFVVFLMLRESVFSHPSKNRLLIITHLRSGMPMQYRDSLRLKEIMMENLLKSQNK